MNILGVSGQMIDIEASLLPGLYKFAIVGLADKSINEARERVTSALVNSSFGLPYGNLTVNLSPAYVEKRGTSFDLPIALSLLLCTNKNAQIKLDLKETIVIGELSLDGKLMKVNSCSAMLIEARAAGFKNVILPIDNYAETNWIKGIQQFPIETLSEAWQVIESGQGIKANNEKVLAAQLASPPSFDAELELDLQLIGNRPMELEVLTIAAAGGHNMLLDGPPGSGKTTLLHRFHKLLPDLGEEQALEVFKINSLINGVDIHDCYRPPQRNPHHSISEVALLGGGSFPQPGEISLAHHGVLGLDEISEFSQASLEGLRQPLVDNLINISRAKYKVTFPARFQLIASRNPCPCGWYGEPLTQCTCTQAQVKSYQGRLSGAILDRIDIKFRVEYIKSYNPTKGVSTGARDNLAKALTQIKLARARQAERYKEINIKEHKIYLTNNDYNNPFDWSLFVLRKSASKLLKDFYREKKLTLRGVFKVGKLARTMADLESETMVSAEKVYRAFLFNSANNKI